MLLSLGLPLPKKVFVHGFITVGGQKMSKSLGNIVDPFDLIEKYGADAVRYFLLREVPSTEDGDFTIDKFEKRYNSDLASGLGNLVSRVLTLANKFKIKRPKLNSGEKNVAAIDDCREKYKKSLSELKFNEALSAVWELIGWCDRYIEKERPWEGRGNKEEVIGNLLLTVEDIAGLLVPFLPDSSQKILKQLKTKRPDPVFPRI